MLGMVAGSPRRTSRPTTDRIALGVVVLASARFAFTAFWGLAGIPGGGHLGAGSVGDCMAAEQIVKWQILSTRRGTGTRMATLEWIDGPDAPAGKLLSVDIV
jgi:hypothetical protein